MQKCLEFVKKRKRIANDQGELETGKRGSRIKAQGFRISDLGSRISCIALKRLTGNAIGFLLLAFSYRPKANRNK